jgi:hypothetical protein
MTDEHPPDPDDLSIPAHEEAKASEPTEHTKEDDGRSVEIDTGFYRVQVWGDTGDSFEAVMAKAIEAADRAKEDAVDLDDRIDDDGRHYR